LEVFDQDHFSMLLLVQLKILKMDFKYGKYFRNH
jgi:hypothetical protein